MSTIADAEFHD